MLDCATGLPFTGQIKQLNCLSTRFQFTTNDIRRGSLLIRRNGQRFADQSIQERGFARIRFSPKEHSREIRPLGGPIAALKENSQIFLNRSQPTIQLFFTGWLDLLLRKIEARFQFCDHVDQSIGELANLASQIPFQHSSGGTQCRLILCLNHGQDRFRTTEIDLAIHKGSPSKLPRRCQSDTGGLHQFHDPFKDGIGSGKIDFNRFISRPRLPFRPGNSQCRNSGEVQFPGQVDFDGFPYRQRLWR